jgi:hypothetical protein
VVDTHLRDLGNRVAGDVVVAVVLGIAALIAHHRQSVGTVDSADLAFLLWALTVAVLARGLFNFGTFLVALYRSE